MVIGGETGDQGCHVAGGGAEDAQVVGLSVGVDGGSIHHKGGGGGCIGNLTGKVGWVEQQLGLGSHVVGALLGRD